jgi:hypothetical protein
MSVEIFNLKPDQILKYSFLPKNSNARRKVEVLEPEKPWAQNLSDTISVLDPFQTRLKLELERRKLKTNDPPLIDAQIWEDPTALVKQYADSIEMHVDQRVLAAFQMFILCYKMPFHFSSSGEAEEQYGSAPTLQLSQIGGKNYPYEAAHHSTLPCLYACKRSDWDAYQAALAQKQPAQRPLQFVYVKYSYGYQRHNSTNCLSKSVNETDSLIDWKAGGTLLRTTTITLANKVALGAINPIQATGQFVSYLKQRVKYLLAHSPSDKVKPVLCKYLEQIKHIQHKIKTAPDFFDKLLDIQIAGENARSAHLREVVYKKRFEMIKADQLIDSRIKWRLKNAPIAYLRGETHDYLKFALIMQSTGQQRTAFCKLFSKTDAVFEETYLQTLESAKYKKNYLAFKKRVENFSKKHETAIAALLQEIQNDFDEIKHAELRFRSSLLKDLIAINNWTQYQFVIQFQAQFPFESMSEAMVSRLTFWARPARKVQYKTPLRQRCKEMSVAKAIKCAHVLQVEPGLFFPSVFTSTQTL